MIHQPRKRLRLLQVCNVGEITGGTAACAWSITRSLPMCEHHIAFLSKISDETRTAFADCRLTEWSRVTSAAVADSKADVVILHNTPASRWNAPLGVPTIRYVHSLSPPGDEDVRWYCSQWLASQCGERGGTVVLQGVPRPLRADEVDREQRTQLIIGRLCTPQLRKWPRMLTDFYRRLSDDFPDVIWEFVGCPASFQAELHTACRGRTRFFAPSWKQRRQLWNWDALLYHHPTLTESFGRTAAEAMRAGCLPIVDARGGFPEQIVEGTGFLCREFDEFAHALQSIVDPVERRRRSENVRDHADRTFSFTRFGHDLRVLLQQIAQISCVTSSTSGCIR